MADLKEEVLKAGRKAEIDESALLPVIDVLAAEGWTLVKGEPTTTETKLVTQPAKTTK